MGKNKPIFYNALMLTAINLLLRFVSTSFQIYLSGMIGAAGIGLLQLVLSVGTLTLTVGMGGIRTATMYLSAETVGQKRQERMIWVLSGCILYSVLLSSGTAIVLYHFAPVIAGQWIGESATTGAVKLLSFFLPVNCLCGVMVGYFTGVGKIGTLAIVEIAEQFFSILTTILLLTLWAGENPPQACCSVIIGSGFGACFTLVTLLILKSRESTTTSRWFSVRKQLLETAVPLAIADNVKAGISTTENLMVPKRLALYPGAVSPMATFGMVCGMVFPILMFPVAILFGLVELLIPELARCNAAGSNTRIRHLTERSLLLALIYGTFCGGILFITAETLCAKLYSTPEAGKYLRLFAVLAPMLYCDAIIDAITKGLGQQKSCVRYNIITSSLDVIILYILLPEYGITGYYISFLSTHLLNFVLSARLLFKIVGKVIRFHTTVFCIISSICAIYFVSSIQHDIARCLVFSCAYFLMLIFTGVIKKYDIVWFEGLLKNK